MSDCCENKSCAVDALKVNQSKTLKIVLAINVFLFLIVFSSGWMSHSTGLMSESLDDLGDAITYALSLFVIYKSNQAKAKVALFKGLLILVGALFVLFQVIQHIINHTIPVFEIMSVVGVIALLGNLTCLYLLTKHKDQDINMSSVWECSRNDIANNIAVIIASLIVWFTQSGWADIVVGLALSIFLLRSSYKVISTAIREI
ncbi:cation transporter [Candidatus Methylopumilus planktonicus]|jgi:cation diffusion facilitator family transporter|uniref:cation transporter n=1 Tax=Candidatus Methylopumilus planktonicus TaxID=1581557 RepID=UPI0011210A4E|nr:cation transporter [Candidatus Methylopumilus planktonicus]QDD10707.1 cation transporter [Candidatus Methylopumilus planktonicus]QDD23176.1 cation transporter [Candidatus Methylopumilus planktonicus]